MDCFHLDFEYNFLSKHFKANLLRIITISDYYEKFCNNFKKFIENCLKEKEEFSKIQFDIKDNCFNDMSICISKFFEQQVIIFKQYNSMFTKIKNDFVKPLNTFHHDLSENYSEILKKLNEGKKIIHYLKKKLNESRRNHYYECEIFEKIKKENDNDFTNEEVINQNYIVEETFNIYKKQLNEINNYIVKYNSEYEILMKKIIELEDNLNSLLKKKFMNLYNIEENCIIRNKDEYPFIIYSSKKDIEKFTNELNFKTKDNRIEMEKYISYQDFKKISPNLINKKIEKKKNNSSDLTFSIAISEGFLYTLKDEDEDNKSNFIHFEPPKKTNEEIINLFIQNIFKSDLLNYDKIQEIKNIISEDNSMIKTFVLNYYNFSPKTFYHFQNEKNLYSIANIFNMILNNLNSSMIEEKIQIIIYILLIGERSYYNNIYLCSLLWENNFLKLKEVWEKLINRRFIQRISFRVKKIIELRNNNNNEIGIFSSFKKLISEEPLKRSLFEGANLDLIKEIKLNTRLKKLGYENQIKNYSYLNNEEKLIIDSEINKNIKKTLFEFIEHLLNYNVSIPDSINLIVDIGSKFDLSSKLINYYILCINTFSLSICRNIKNNETREKINDLIQKRDITIKLRYPCSLIKDKEKKFVLSNLCKYLKNKELIPLFLLKKSISTKIKYNFYLNYLNSNKEISIEIRLKIWKSILDIKKVILEIKDKIKEIDKNSEKYKLIEQDIKRTHLGEDSKEKNNILINILMKVTNLIELNLDYQNEKNKYEYYQGMNYLSAFIYLLTNNENESVYLLYSILINTELKNIYCQKMLKLKNFFPIFEKLLKLYIPSISFYLKKNSVKVEYFLTPFVLTIFTNVIQNKNNIPLIILNIWDEFLIKGWKSLINSILILIKFHINDILNKSGDELFKFLINDLSQSAFFDDENYYLWNNEKFNIKKRYLKVLEEEVEFEKNKEE